MSYLYPRLPKRFDECIYRELSANSVVLAYVSTLYRVRDLFTPRRPSDNCQPTSFLARRYTNYIVQHVTRQAALWSANTQVADALRKKSEFYPFLLSFFLENLCSIFNSNQWNTREQDFWEKCWGREFYAVLLLSRLYLISYFRFRMRLCVRIRSLRYAKTVDTDYVSARLRSIHAHWPSSLVYWRSTSYLVESFNFVKKHSPLFFFFFLFQSFDHTIATIRRKHLYLFTYNLRS